MKDELKMGLRSLAYRKKQYVSLFLVSVFGIAISLFSLFVIKGMLKSLEEKAKIYYGGDMQIIGETTHLWQDSSNDVFPKLKKIFPPDTIITPRFNFNADSTAFFFEGNQVNQKIINGVDFNLEKDLFSTFNYIEGGCEDISGTNGILISYPIAKELQVHVGDEILFMFKTVLGYIDTTTLIVKGIFKDSSVFGVYTSYMDKYCLLDNYNVKPSIYNRICISLPNGAPTKKELQMYQKKLEEVLPMFPLVEEKNSFYSELNSLPMPTYALITLSANLEDLQILIDAMKLIAAFIIIMLIIIIVAGVSSTFRVIVMKRINEIGIYKAIGMKRQKIIEMLLVETMLLLIVGCIVGFFVSLLLCKSISLINFSFVTSFDMFLANGYLAPIVTPGFIFIICGAVIVTTLISVLFSIRKSVSITPCEALAATE